MRRASTPNQGYSARRSSAGYGGPREAHGEMANIWEVVAALASALQVARNQLVNLMHTSRPDPMRLSPMRVPPMRLSPMCVPPMRLSGGGCDSRRATPGRAGVHGAHAQGHVLTAGYPVRYATPRRVRPREIYAEMSAQQAGRPCTHPLHSMGGGARTPAPADRRCTHPTHPMHGMGAEARTLTPAKRGQPRWPSGQVKGCMKAHGDEPSRGDRACSGKTSNGSPNSTPEQRPRHCIAKQFASLLTHETHQQRERRLADELMRDQRPSWRRF